MANILRISFIALSNLLLGGIMLAQPVNLGVPPVAHYSRRAFHAGTQTWDSAQDKNGVILLANNEGLLTFDGNHWNCLPVANGTCVRSVAADAATGRIFVGAQGEMGYFSPDEQGCLRYQSLNHLLPENERSYGDVWDIAAFQNSYFFRTNDRVFRFDGQQMSVVYREGVLEQLGTVNGQMLLHSSKQGLMRFTGQEFEVVCAAPPGIITSFLPWKSDTVLISTLKNGIFSLTNGQLAPWNTAADVFLKEKRIYSATVFNNDQIALGTTLGGLVVLDANRRPRIWLRKGMGLQFNNILSVRADRSGNLWLGLDNGIDYVEINAPFYRIFPDGDLEGAGYAAYLFDNRLYLGTSNGLYSTPWRGWYDPFENRTFQLVSGTTGQVWGLNEAGGALLMGHHEGAFQIKGEQATLLTNRAGTWRYLRLNDSLVIAGQYDGLSIFHKGPGGSWQWRLHLPGFDESSRILAPENDSTFWVSHPYRGVFSVHLRRHFQQAEAIHYGKNEGLPSDLFNYVYQVGGRILVAGEHGIYYFDKNTRRFIVDPGYAAQFPDHSRTLLLYGDQKENVWFVNGREAGVLWVQDEGLGKKIRRQVFPQAEGQMVGGFEHIFSPDAHNSFLGTEKGFLHLNPDRLLRTDTTLQVVFHSVRLPHANDSLLFGGFGVRSGFTAELPYQNTGIRIAYSATAFGESRRILYSTRLEGLEKNWSAWSAKTEQDYSHLPAGKYRLQVRARDEFGHESAPVELEFRVLPPWYTSNWALLVYFALGIGLLMAFVRHQRRRFEREKAALTLRHQEKEALHIQQAEQTNQELVRLQNEKLEAEIVHKNEELALATMHLVQKGEVIATIQEALERSLEKDLNPNEFRQELRRLLRLLQADSRADQDWEQFAVHFDQVYGDFLKRLREQFPQLSPNDYRLCAYLRMNLNTKEIAHLLNISVRGVEGSRYRLRRKLELSNDANLVDFLMGV